MTPSHTRLPVPGLLWGDYPERARTPRAWSERIATPLRHAADRLADAAHALRRRHDAAWLARVHSARMACAAQPFAMALAAVRARLLREGFTPETQAQALGLVAQATHTTLGVMPFDTQLIAARAVLDNRLAEMATGEGKTLAVALAASVGGLAGMPVHVVTANDYLVARDAARAQPLARALGLTVGRVVQADERSARATAYACDIVYVTAKELAFDYLRDGLDAGSAQAPRARRDAPAAPLARLRSNAATPALLRGLCMAIVDEADAILIDEARVPLILSQAADGGAAQAHASQALQFARGLRAGHDFTLDTEAHAAQLTDAGRDALAAAAARLDAASSDAAWKHRLHREHAVATALAALHLYQADRHYVVREGAVQIVDETTGRIAEGRVWSNGLQQLVEAKEGVAPSASMQTLAQITYQRFFPRYLRLGGLSGTLSEARAELLATYGLSVRRVPLRQRSRRVVGATRLHADHAALWRAVAERIAALHRSGRPVLAACDSVAEAQALSHCLAARGLAHALLHARNDAAEADVIARAGQRGAITVTTNMAGRGTDIELGAGVDAQGGLHVICCQLNSARRIDRQLAGRAARQGDAGSVETQLSLDHALLARSLPAAMRTLLRRHAAAVPSPLARALARWPQRREEHRQRVQRQRLIDHDERIERQLGFAGACE